jgi:adenine-specific DNA-methyltransferase
MIKYLGSKRVLVPRIVSAVEALAPGGTVLDLFSGTARVAHAIKLQGHFTIANDHNHFAYVLARCYVQADGERLAKTACKLIAELSALPPRAGYFTETFCERSRFFHPRNGARIDAIREAIAGMDLEPDLEAVLLVSLMEAADRVDSTTGVQMAYLKGWAPRALKDLELRLPALLPGRGRAMRAEAEQAVTDLEVDIAYLDPPYNQHSYLGNYHVWETLVRWDRPSVYGVACKRVDCRRYRSPFNSKREIHAALARLVRTIRASHLIVSFNNEGYVRKDDLAQMLRQRGHVQVLEVDFKRYVGAQIGIHDPQGRKVGRVSHLRNTEYLFIVSESQRAVERALAAAQRSS